MNDHLAFMTPHHHAIRNFVVRELPRNSGRPLSPTQIAKALRLDSQLVTGLLEDLEKHLFFLVRNRRVEVSWAFPVTCDRTPHRLRFSTGERIFGA
ncbi:MAG: MarR family transcriptional regulator [Acidobacteriia bacterium]|nr:MarR family transcriptional regulator [Terriglobia bacterium]